MCELAYDAIIRCPFAKKAEGKRYELALVLGSKDVENEITPARLKEISRLTGQRLTLSADQRLLAHGLSGSVIRGFISSDGQDLLLNAWIYAIALNEVFGINVDIVFSHAVVPLPFVQPQTGHRGKLAA